MFRKCFSLFALLSAALVLNACNNYNLLQDSQVLSGTQTGLGEEALISTEIVQRTTLSSCQHCHSGLKQPILNSKATVLASLGKVQSEVFSEQMPPRSSGYKAVTECEKEILKKWVELGTPDTSNVKVSSLPGCANSTPKPPESIPISQMPLDYQTLATKILQPKCLNCHNPDGDPDAQDILLFPYSELASKPTLLGTSSAQSKLVRMVTRTDEERMPPPESNIPALTSEEIDFLKKWIDAGHPETVN